MFFIYARKSKQTEKGESIENQITMCRDYLLRNHNAEVPDEYVFIDYGISAKNTKREEYQRMMHLAEKLHPIGLACYKLDRLSRDVGDIADLVDQLEKYDVKFISVKENFDTTTPIGRAMLMTAGVFSQLERETAGERSRDNKLLLAETGRWLGGRAPLGFKSVPVVYEYRGKEHDQKMLSPVPSEMETLLHLFAKYAEFHSLTQLVCYCIQNGIKNRSNKNFSLATLQHILNNPVYVVADDVMLDYFLSKGCVIPEKMISRFDGKHGIMAYNRTDQGEKTKGRYRDMSEWIIAVGQHEGPISSDLWLTCQGIREKNSDKTYRKSTSDISMLSGILLCKCGAYMRPKASRNQDGSIRYYYICESKERSHKYLCDNGNIRGDTIDKIVIDEVLSISHNKTFLTQLLQQRKKRLYGDFDSPDDMLQAENRIEEIEKEIKNITKLLRNSDESTEKYLIDELKDLDKEKNTICLELDKLKQIASEKAIATQSVEILQYSITHFAKTLDTLSMIEKREFLKSIISRVVWDGENVHIYLYDETFPPPLHRKCNVVTTETLYHSIFLSGLYMKNEAFTLIKRYRLMRGMEQQELAKLCGVSRDTIWRMENNLRKHDPDILNKIYEILQIPSD